MNRHTEPDDATLIARVLAGDADAFEPLVRRYQGRIFAALCRVVGDREDAADLAQETFVKAFQNLARFRQDASFHTWLFRIAMNAAVSFHRRQRRRPAPAAGAGRDEPRSPAADPADESPGPVQRLEAEERRQMVLDALNGLEPEFRVAIVMRDLEGCTYEEMSEALGWPLGTVKSRIHRARLALRDLLAPRMALSD